MYQHRCHISADVLMTLLTDGELLSTYRRQSQLDRQIDRYRASVITLNRCGIA